MSRNCFLNDATPNLHQALLIFRWKREIRVKKMDNRMKGETWYYTPCGRRMKQFPEIIKVTFAVFKAHVFLKTYALSWS